MSHQPLDPQPFYVQEADEHDAGPLSGKGRYTYAEGTAYDDYGRETIVTALARFLPRPGFEKNIERYREDHEKGTGSA